MTSPAPQFSPNEFDPAAYEERAGELPVGRMTFAEYLVFADRHPDRRYEYVGGLVYGMSNGSRAHALIGSNLTAILHAGARASKCSVYANSMRVLTPSDAGYVPDIMVSCGPRAPLTGLYEVHPCLIAEVLSPSTREVDMGEKLEHYREVETLQAYWIVEATWRCVYRHWRDTSGAWQYELIVGDGELPVPCPVETAFTLDEVYGDVDVPREPPPEPPRPLRLLREPGAEYVAAEHVAVPAR